MKFSSSWNCIWLFSFGFFILPGLLTSCGSGQELSVSDFKFDGPIGSEDAVIERLGKNIFKITLAHAPENPDWSNKLNFQITGHAKGNDLVLVVEGPPRYPMNEYFQSWSYDMENWNPVYWKAGGKVRSKYSRETDTLVLPVFRENQVWVGHQVPMSYDQVEDLIESIRSNRNVKIHTLGKSLGGRNLYRITISDPSGEIPESHRWGHYFINQHPGEHNAQWRIVGMIEWLLSEQGSHLRKHSICHFVIMMSPDGPQNGWYRNNAQGVDMNRSYCAEGADPAKQAHEPSVFQRDLERIMASETPVTTLWGNHTWGGIVEPLLYVAEDENNTASRWMEWRDILESIDRENLIKPLALRDRPGSGGTTWEYGPHLQFGITTILCEGAGALHTREQNEKSGSYLIESLDKFYSGTRR